MDYWINPVVLEAEGDWTASRIKSTLLHKKGPENVPASIPEDPNSFLVQRENLFPMGSLEGIPITSTAQESSDSPSLNGMQERVSVL